MEPLTPLDRELDAALAVDPSPEFLARVRIQVASEPIAPRWSLSHLVLAGSALSVVAYVVVVGLLGVQRTPQPHGDVVLPHRSAAMEGQGLKPTPSNRAELKPTPSNRAGLKPTPLDAPGLEPARSTGVAMPLEVIVSPSEMAALQRLFGGTNPVTVLPEPVPDELVIPELSIVPIAFPAPAAGEGQ